MNVLLSCDANPYYYDFWPYVKEVWQERIGINPKLVFINDSKQTHKFVDSVMYVKKLDNYPIYLQAQLARIYYTQFFEEEICLLSDIDMFPVSKKFFDKQKIKENCDYNTFFHLNPEVREFGQLPLCYYCGYGKTYKKLLKDLSWEEFLKKIISLNFDVTKSNFTLPNHLKNNNLWFSDEIYMFTEIKKNNLKIKKNNETAMGRRVDREEIKKINYLNFFNDKIVDIHMPRPPHNYKDCIDKIFYGLV